MLHHRTNDPALRAMSIAEREAEPVWQNTGDYGTWREALSSTYDQVLKEFQSTEKA